MMRLSEAAAMAGGVLVGEDVLIEAVSSDSRRVKAGDLFVALSGPNFDGNDYAPAARAAGAVAALLSRAVPGAEGLPHVLVDDTRQALGRLGAAWRRNLPLRLVGVTGSNGKTTVKEMIAAILAEAGPTWATQGNLNNDIGVPLTLLNLRPRHRYAVVEMGANHAGEIAYLAGLAQPDLIVLNNAGAAHLQGFGSLEGVARAKGELISALAGDGAAVLNRDDDFWPLWRELAGARRVIAFGTAAAADMRLLADSFRGEWCEDGYASHFSLRWEGGEWPLRLALPGRHNALNAAAAAAATLGLGLDMATVRAGLAKIRSVPGRMQPCLCSCGARLFNDSYNANPASFAAALDVLAGLPGEHWVVLGGFGELGEAGAALHAGLGRAAKARGVARLFATGPLAEQAVQSFGDGAGYFDKPEELIQVVQESLHKDVVMLVKGSRSQRMERVVEALCAESCGRDARAPREAA